MMRKTVWAVVFISATLFIGFAWAQDTRPQDVGSVEAPAAKAADAARDETADLLRESDRLWKNRHVSGNDAKSILRAEKALNKGADEFEAKWRIARGCFWMAENSGKKQLKITYGEKGWKAGERAAELRPGRVEGWFWGVVALGQYAKGVGILKSVWKGLSGRFEEMNEKAIKIDRGYAFAGPLRSYGRYWYKLPVFKRDYDRSEKLLREAVKAYPPKLRTHFYLAETYLANDKRDLAGKELETCLGLDPRKEEYADGIIYKKECRKLYDKEFEFK